MKLQSHLTEAFQARRRCLFLAPRLLRLQVSTRPPAYESAELEDIGRRERGVMAWSLGEFADLLWIVVPEFRGPIVELACKELNEGREYDRLLTPISDYDLATELYFRVLVPALEDLPAQRDIIGRCLGVMNRLMQAEERGRYYWNTFNVEIFGPLIGRGWSAALSVIDSELMNMVQRRRSGR